MGVVAYRILILLWFLAYMAAIYLALHVLVARVSRNPGGRLLWFFEVLTGPLIRPVRAILPSGVGAARLRMVALGVYVALWLGFRFWLARSGGLAGG